MRDAWDRGEVIDERSAGGPPALRRFHGLAGPGASRIGSALSWCADGVTGAHTASATGQNPVCEPDLTFAFLRRV
jgi:hypothetical protein